MAQENEELRIVRRLVVVFDICSSTTILEDLKRTDHLTQWRDLLIAMKDRLQEAGHELGMELYKFIGDGWVLLFPDSVAKDRLCNLLKKLSAWFQNQFEITISPLLSRQPSPVGLMFGVDSGELVRLNMDDRTEYIGRAINVAARLQSNTKALSGGPSYKALFSRNSFNSPAPPPASIKVEPTSASLRNISPSTIECFVFQTCGDSRQDERTSVVHEDARFMNVLRTPAEVYGTIPKIVDTLDRTVAGEKKLLHAMLHVSQPVSKKKVPGPMETSLRDYYASFDATMTRCIASTGANRWFVQQIYNIVTLDRLDMVVDRMGKGTDGFEVRAFCLPEMAPCFSPLILGEEDATLAILDSSNYRVGAALHLHGADAAAFVGRYFALLWDYKHTFRLRSEQGVNKEEIRALREKIRTQPNSPARR
ncbi:MAG: hypothetical protein WA748_07755 [Candidatus Acidiferrum sp.]